MSPGGRGGEHPIHVEAQRRPVVGHRDVLPHADVGPGERHRNVGIELRAVPDARVQAAVAHLEAVVPRLHHERGAARVRRTARLHPGHHGEGARQVEDAEIDEGVGGEVEGLAVPTRGPAGAGDRAVARTRAVHQEQARAVVEAPGGDGTHRGLRRGGRCEGDGHEEADEHRSEDDEVERPSLQKIPGCHERSLAEVRK